jgi:hypothetical protein
MVANIDTKTKEIGITTKEIDVATKETDQTVTLIEDTMMSGKRQPLNPSSGDIKVFSDTDRYSPSAPGK